MRLRLIVLLAIVVSASCGASAPEHDRTLDPSLIDWAPTRGRECHAEAPYHGACQGPRRVPIARGPAAARARALGLGTRMAASRLMVGTPLPSWVEAVGTPADETMTWPVPGGRLFRGFGFVRRGRRELRHDGVDILGPIGARIVAANGGLVAYADNGVQGYGNFLAILHADRTTTFYAHCRSIFVAPGERVRRGQVVAEVGVTGITRAPHLHFEWHARGRAVDPMPRLERPDRD